MEALAWTLVVALLSAVSWQLERAHRRAIRPPRATFWDPADADLRRLNGDLDAVRARTATPDDATGQSPAQRSAVAASPQRSITQCAP